MKTTIDMAREAGFFENTGDGQGVWIANTSCLKAFEALVRADEREACAKVCEDIDVEYEGEDVLATWCAAAIRARGKT